MFKGVLILNKECTGVDLRLYKAVRLIILYSYRANNCGWTRSYKERYTKACDRMWVLFHNMLLKHYDVPVAALDFPFKISGSTKVIDLEADRDLEFILIKKETK